MPLPITSISIVVPVFNDQEVLLELYKRLKLVLDRLTEEYEIIFVDDGSRDRSWQEIVALKQKDDKIVAVQFIRNFGHANAITAGLDISKNEIIVLIDSDLQDAPEDIPTLIEALQANNVLMAIAQREERQDSWVKIFLSKFFFVVSNSVTNLSVEPSLGVFRAMKREAFDALRQFPENTATSLSLLYYIGSSYVAVPLKREARYAGKSGYSLQKMVSLALSRIFSFSFLPIRLSFYIGITMILLSLLSSFGLVFVDNFLNQGWIYIGLLIISLFGLNFVFLAVLGEYLGKVLLEAKRRPKYIIRQLLSGQR